MSSNPPSAAAAKLRYGNEDAIPINALAKVWSGEIGIEWDQLTVDLVTFAIDIDGDNPHGLLVWDRVNFTITKLRFTRKALTRAWSSGIDPFKKTWKAAIDGDIGLEREAVWAFARLKKIAAPSFWPDALASATPTNRTEHEYATKADVEHQYRAHLDEFIDRNRRSPNRNEDRAWGQENGITNYRVSTLRKKSLPAQVRKGGRGAGSKILNTWKTCAKTCKD